MLEVDRPQFSIHDSLREVFSSPVYTLATKQYRRNYFSNEEVNAIPWAEFRLRSNSIAYTTIPGTNLEALVVPKSRTWSSQDTNVYVGSDDKLVQSFSDFSKEEFEAVFDWHISIGLHLSQMYNKDVHISHGFNPEDTAPDAHSVRSKFHTHVYIPDFQHRERVSIKDLSWFDRLKLVEPYSGLYYDYAKEFFDNNELGCIDLQKNEGHFSLTKSIKTIDRQYWATLYELLKGMNDKYEEIVEIFTDRTIESKTQHKRFIPRVAQERLTLLDHFLTKNQNWLTARSISLIRGLANDIRSATPRQTPNSTHISNSSQLWAAKGFSGAFNFRVSDLDQTINFDFAPRVISTSGATKFITDHPTIVIKDSDEATAEEISELKKFEDSFVDSIFK